jgi:hypothetical protein
MQQPASMMWSLGSLGWLEIACEQKFMDAAPCKNVDQQSTNSTNDECRVATERCQHIIVFYLLVVFSFCVHVGKSQLPKPTH